MSALEELPFDQFQRYGALRLTVERLRHRLSRRLRILDVGDWNGLAARFCPEDLTVWLDPDGRGSGRYVQSDGRMLPFGDRAFDVVACLDALEHVPRAGRPQVVAELQRVAGSALVIAVPYADDGAPAHEASLAGYVRRVLGGEQQQLREHAEHGLPTEAEARGWLDAAGWRSLVSPSGLLSDWLLMMLAKHQLLAVPGSEPAHRALDARYNRARGPIDPARPGYRLVLMAVRQELGDLLDELSAAIGAPRSAADPEDVAAAHRALLAAHAARSGVDVKLGGAVDGSHGWLAETSAALDARVRALADDARAQRSRAEAAEARVRAFERGHFIRSMALLRRLLART